MRSLPIRLRLTLVYAAAMALVLGTVGVYGYSRLAAAFSADLDRELKQRVQDLSGPLRRPHNTLGELVGRGLIEHGESFAEVVTPAGRVLQATVTLRNQPLLSPAEAARATTSRMFLDRPSAPGLNEPARLLATPITFKGDGRVLIVGATRENGLETLRAIRWRMVVVGPLLLLVTSFMAYVLAAAALRPVERMRRQAARMKATASGQRLAVLGTRDEVARLGGTLNDLLADVEDSVERERRFVANASHELRTPLALLRTELDLATRRRRSRSELQATVDSASVEVDRLVALANELLVLARESDAGLPLVRQRVSVCELLASCAGRFASQQHLRALVTDPGDVTTLCADQSRLRQALVNLVDNAFGHGHGTVEVAVLRRGDTVEVHVTDEGPGLPPEMLNRAFDRFSHAEGSRGVGLGLAIVAQIAQAHGGHAGIRNRTGGGVDAWISLPDADAHLAADTEPAERTR